MKVLGKGNVWRVVPLFPMVRQVLSEVQADHAKHFGASPSPKTPVFIGHGGGRMSENTISTDFKDLRRSAGLDERFSLHSTRHTFGSWCAMSGVNLQSIRDWMGHSTITTTEIYAHLLPDYVPEFDQKLFED